VESDNTDEVIVDIANIEDLIGPPQFSSSKIYREMPAGVVVGLAYNEYGGSTLYIEAQQASF
jgi:ATP-dependent Lon protease